MKESRAPVCHCNVDSALTRSTENVRKLIAIRLDCIVHEIDQHMHQVLTGSQLTSIWSYGAGNARACVATSRDLKGLLDEPINIDRTARIHATARSIFHETLNRPSDFLNELTEQRHVTGSDNPVVKTFGQSPGQAPHPIEVLSQIVCQRYGYSTGRCVSFACHETRRKLCIAQRKTCVVRDRCNKLSLCAIKSPLSGASRDQDEANGISWISNWNNQLNCHRSRVAGRVYGGAQGWAYLNYCLVLETF